GRDDEAELVAVVGAAGEKILGFDRIPLRTIKRTAFALARGAVALQVAQVRGRGVRALAGEPHDAGLDHDAAALERAHPAAASEQPPDAGRAADAAAGGLPAPPRGKSRPAARQV